jgi:hypothetical protein
MRTTMRGMKPLPRSPVAGALLLLVCFVAAVPAAPKTLEQVYGKSPYNEKLSAVWKKVSDAGYGLNVKPTVAMQEKFGYVMDFGHGAQEPGGRFDVQVGAISMPKFEGTPLKTTQLVLDSIKKLLGDTNVTLESVPWVNQSLNVRAQSPPAGQPIYPGIKVKLTVPHNPDAVPAATKPGEKPGNPGTDSGGISEGLVGGGRDSAETRHTPPGMVAVPNVVGLKWDSAASLIRRAKLREVRKNQPDDDTAQWDVVQTQKPLSGSLARPGRGVVCAVGIRPRNPFGLVTVVLLLVAVVAVLGLAAIGMRSINVSRRRRKLHQDQASHAAPSASQWARSQKDKAVTVDETIKRAGGRPIDRPTLLTENDLGVLRRVSRDYDDDRNYWIKEMLQLRNSLTFAAERISTLEARRDASSGTPRSPSSSSSEIAELRDELHKVKDMVELLRGERSSDGAASRATPSDATQGLIEELRQDIARMTDRLSAIEHLEQEFARISAIYRPMEQALSQGAKLQDRLARVERQLSGYSVDEPSMFDVKNLEQFYNTGLRDRKALGDFTTKYRPRSVQIVRRDDHVVLREAVSTALLALSHHDEWFVVPVHTADRYQRADLEACFELEEERTAEANSEFIRRLVQPARCQPTAGGWRLLERGKLVVSA